MSETLHYYVNIPGKSPYFSSVQEALDALDDCPMAPKSFPAPMEDIPPAVIHIGAGIYRERLTVCRPYVTFLGESANNTVLVYGLGAFEQMPAGDKRGTFRTASIHIDTHDFTAKNLTFQNDAGYGHTVGQALALYVDGDRILFEECRIIGSQDTLFTAPLPPTEALPGGFKGPGEHKPRILGRHCYRSCYIQGDIDFIFGGAIAYFEDCTLFSKLPCDRVLTKELSDKEPVYGYVTAASTPSAEPFGYVFSCCKLESDCPPNTVYLGRPWREWAKTVFLHCELGPHIHPEGWHDWNKPHGHFYFGEYDSFGPGASKKRASFAHLLDEADASVYTAENILKGWKP